MIRSVPILWLPTSPMWCPVCWITTQILGNGLLVVENMSPSSWSKCISHTRESSFHLEKWYKLRDDLSWNDYWWQTRELHNQFVRYHLCYFSSHSWHVLYCQVKTKSPCQSRYDFLVYCACPLIRERRTKFDLKFARNVQNLLRKHECTNSRTSRKRYVYMGDWARFSNFITSSLANLIRASPSSRLSLVLGFRYTRTYCYKTCV